MRSFLSDSSQKSTIREMYIWCFERLWLCGCVCGGTCSKTRQPSPKYHRISGHLMCGTSESENGLRRWWGGVPCAAAAWNLWDAPWRNTYISSFYCWMTCCCFQNATNPGQIHFTVPNFVCVATWEMSAVTSLSPIHPYFAFASLDLAQVKSTSLSHQQVVAAMEKFLCHRCWHL